MARGGPRGLKLGYLLIDYGFFHKGHRAIDDCHALLQLLASPLRTSGRRALSCLLDTARRPTVRLWAQGSPIETKHLLKARRCRWSQRRRSWYIDLDEEQLEIERSYLSATIFGRAVGHLPADRFTARDRFSVRTDPEIPPAQG